LHGSFWERDDRRVGTAARSLAVATVTIEHDDWVSATLVTHCATRTSAGQFLCHNRCSVFCQFMLPPSRTDASSASECATRRPDGALAIVRIDRDTALRIILIVPADPCPGVGQPFFVAPLWRRAARLPRCRASFCIASHNCPLFSAFPGRL